MKKVFLWKNSEFYVEFKKIVNGKKKHVFDPQKSKKTVKKHRFVKICGWNFNCNKSQKTLSFQTTEDMYINLSWWT